MLLPLSAGQDWHGRHAAEDNVPTGLAASWRHAQVRRDDCGAQAWINTIFPATLQAGNPHLVLRGTNFQLKVWESLLRIPAGQVVSYSQLATLVGCPQAQREVGSALAANVVAYLIPCNRVIRESGELNHYRWGSSQGRTAGMGSRASSMPQSESRQSITEENGWQL